MLSNAKKLLLFLIPILLVFAFPLTVFIVSREYYSLSSVLETQAAHPDALFGVAYSDMTQAYKKALVAGADPEVVALGTSRVMEFRKELFSDPGLFVNAGGVEASIEDMKTFITELPPGGRTKLVILGLDQRMFRPDYEPLYSKQGSDTINRAEYFFGGAWKKIYGDYFAGKFTIGGLLKESTTDDSVGLSALVDRNGFRSDGSYQFGKAKDDPQHERTIASQIAQVSESIKQDRGGFEYETSVSRSALDSLALLLQACKERGITVIGFLPPYPAEFYRDIIGVDDAYARTALELPKDIREIFLKNGSSFYDFTDASTLGATQSEFADPYHGTDKMYLQMMIYLTEHDPDLKWYTDLGALKKMLEGAGKDFLDTDNALSP